MTDEMERGKGSPLSFESQYGFYHAYHKERRNQLVHIVGVPLIVLASLMLLRTFRMDGMVTSAYIVWYILLDLQYGLAAVPYLLTLWGAACVLHQTLGAHNAHVVAFVLNVCSWAAQILSHKHFEGNRPALLDNLLQAFVMAPLFVYIEVLMAFGLFSGRMSPLLERLRQQEAQIPTKKL
eukprot:Plantae.Rhodophyta-Purpureofilum_apyrenoidigerum.ctg10728.p1 GENE.Plantae.Rhodophyta-Purpureofilum_apyrenoidigerum.ctg10728~~Plantae.Rhodophyta-Purpureofilum_apyrenoidigerum.ctg10728.p1  ORF type:complete len:180 (+),score=17.86 Plantae.Rhodophyta-Purpureofilum_apyrenoidigerum.ctg10728:89-628(+)